MQRAGPVTTNTHITLKQVITLLNTIEPTMQALLTSREMERLEKKGLIYQTAAAYFKFQVH